MEIPKIINRSQLAAELGITKQALSQWIKKGLSIEQEKKIKYILIKYLTFVN
jgi:predicted DNA binding protein